MTDDLGNTVDNLSSGLPRDLAEQATRQDLLHQLSRLAVLHARLATTLAGNADLSQILQTCCQHLVDGLDFTRAQVWLANDGERSFHLGAPRDRDSRVATADDRTLQESVIQRIAEQRIAHWSNHVASDSSLSQAYSGVSAFAAYPLIVEDQVVGVLTLFASEAFADQVLEHLQPMAGAIAQCIARKESTRALLNRERQLYLALAAGRLGTWQWDANTDRVTWSDQLYELFGYSKDQFVPTRSGFLDAVVPEKFALDQLIEDVRSIMEIRAVEKNLQLDVEYASKIPAVIESDLKRLKQILINLVGNAIKFTRHGRVRVKVQFESQRQPQLRITIIDSGIGMSPAQREQLFEPFSQGDATVTREYGGTGLGLAISRRLANLLGGDIVASSTEGVGSEFTVTLSVGDISGVAMIDPGKHADVAEQAAADVPITLSCHVLVVDDRRDLRFLSRRLLTKAGATVDEAEDGAVAVQYIRQRLETGELPQLILLDMQMPNLDGYQTAKQLRGMGYQHPIIALTADAMQGDMNRCLQSGCNAYLSKPIDVTRLVELVHQLTNAGQ